MQLYITVQFGTIPFTSLLLQGIWRIQIRTIVQYWYSTTYWVPLRNPSNGERLDTRCQGAVLAVLAQVHSTIHDVENKRIHHTNLCGNRKLRRITVIHTIAHFRFHTRIRGNNNNDDSKPQTNQSWVKKRFISPWSSSDTSTPVSCNDRISLLTRLGAHRCSVVYKTSRNSAARYLFGMFSHHSVVSFYL